MGSAQERDQDRAHARKEPLEGHGRAASHPSSGGAGAMQAFPTQEQKART